MLKWILFVKTVWHEVWLKGHTLLNKVCSYTLGYIIASGSEGNVQITLPLSSGYGRRLMFKRSWVRIPAPYTGWIFLTLICCKNYIACLKKTENKRKRGRDDPFKETLYRCDCFITWLINLLISCFAFQSGPSQIYLNVTTLEDRDLTIELSASGFRVASTRHY